LSCPYYITENGRFPEGIWKGGRDGELAYKSFFIDTIIFCYETFEKDDFFVFREKKRWEVYMAT